MSIIGNAAPHFSGEAAKDGEIVNISLDNYKGRWLVLFFYPLDFTFVCPTELVAFSDKTEAFNALGADVLGVSVDSVHTHLAWTRTPRSEAGVGELAYPLLSDLDKDVARAYDVLAGSVALRGVFIIDPDGVVQSGIINNLDVGRNVDEVLRTLKGFQYARETGNVCQANWNDGEAGMSASLDGVKGKIG
ncbi:MAG: peroxiredoxin (alkyl hydroperoxide reductase subunit C) [Myxococcota bacterium]|jgi:peroxiredoxin (alkyl hydroperoxide reductase subunit C)